MTKSAVPRGGRNLTINVRTAKQRSPGSAAWLKRQLNDPYVAAAKQQGWRSRGAFKLLELDDRFHIIHRGARVIDLGCAPGGWTQVAMRRGAASVVGIDLLPMDPIPGSTLIQGGLDEPGMVERLMSEFDGRPDLVLSDMAPNTTGHPATDHLRIMALAELAAAFAGDVLAEGGAFVAKVFQGGSERAMLEALKRDFTTVRHAKPPASRKESSELYVVAMGFRGRSTEWPVDEVIAPAAR
jgi:23S rRNA (uridine2552-2'-O)-methyltransferase